MKDIHKFPKVVQVAFCQIFNLAKYGDRVARWLWIDPGGGIQATTVVP